MGYFGGIGTLVGIKRIVKGIEKCFPVPIPHFTIGQKELQFTIPKFEESCHLYFRVLLRVFDEPVCEVGCLCEDGGSDVGVAVKVPRHDAAQHAALADQGAPGVAAEQIAIAGFSQPLPKWLLR